MMYELHLIMKWNETIWYFFRKSILLLSEILYNILKDQYRKTKTSNYYKSFFTKAWSLHKLLQLWLASLYFHSEGM